MKLLADKKQPWKKNKLHAELLFEIFQNFQSGYPLICLLLNLQLLLNIATTTAEEKARNNCLAIDCFCKNAPSQIFDRIQNTTLPTAVKCSYSVEFQNQMETSPKLEGSPTFMWFSWCHRDMECLLYLQLSSFEYGRKQVCIKCCVVQKRIMGVKPEILNWHLFTNRQVLHYLLKITN